ncbi:MAG: NAD(P)/FAD-dependent oxidoreductase [Candidatus Thorarchaeota archaeon]|nr:NAD(P)/FAD-dependent oxidoreductase [Candidatus Thorarchaeota archaeon]
MYDLIVVGSGPAGSTCARKAALQGVKVLLIEKESHPRTKPCGGALSPRAHSILDFDIDDVIETRIHGAFFYSPSGKRLEFYRSDITGSLVDRARFDALLVDKAREAGVETIGNSRVVAVEQTRKGVRVLTRGDSHRCNLLVGADGVNSTVAKATGIRQTWPAERVALCISTEALVDSKAIARTMSIASSRNGLGIELFFGRVGCGYAWCFPKKRSLNIGIGTPLDQAGRLKEAWKAFVMFLEAKKELELDVSSAQAFKVPIGGIKERLTSRRTMLVGDAAGLASPITGEGIYYALESGRLAASLATKAVRQKNPLLVRMYDQHIQKLVVNELRAARLLAGVFYRSPRNIELIWETCNKDSQMKDYILDLIIGIKSPVELGKSMAKRLVVKHPTKAIRLGL